MIQQVEKYTQSTNTVEKLCRTAQLTKLSQTCFIIQLIFWKNYAEQCKSTNSVKQHVLSYKIDSNQYIKLSSTPRLHENK